MRSHHGLRAKKIDNAVAPELRAAYETLRKQYLDDYKRLEPSRALSSTMVIFAAWQLYKTATWSSSPTSTWACHVRLVAARN